MPIIGKVGRRSWKVRILHMSIHIILLLGSVTMIYPFMMMISASFKSRVDSINFSIFPEYFYDEEVLYKKYIESRFNEESNLLVAQYKNRYLAFNQIKKPEYPNLQFFLDWQIYINQNMTNHKVYDYYIAEQFGRGVYPRNERKFRNLMKLENKDSIENFNKTYNIEVLSWDEVRIEEKNILSRSFSSSFSGFLGRYNEFREKLPPWHRVYGSLDGHFIQNELIPHYRGDLAEMNRLLGTDFPSWGHVILTKTLPEKTLSEHWQHYVKNILNIHHIRIEPQAVQLYREYLEKKYEKIQLLNSTYGTSIDEFNKIEIRNEIPHSGAQMVDWIFFVENIVPAEYIKLSSVEYNFRDWLRSRYVKIENLNQAYHLGYDLFSEIALPSEMPVNNLKLQSDWLDFIRFYAHDSSIELKMTVQQDYLQYLETKFPSDDGAIDLKIMNENYDTNHHQKMDIYPQAKLPKNSNYRKDWLYFVRNVVRGKFLKINTNVETERWHEYLTRKYNYIGSFNKTHGLVFKDFSEIPLDYESFDYFYFKEHKQNIFWEFVKRNYSMVLDLMLYNGRAIVNTLIYCSLAILAALLVNPLAAYAMSRFKLKATYQILLILMLTMAFPPMVMGIPSFIILKKFNMLNTFFALILPAMADGYFIFLLKGFFDSLPKELFESATMDGAGEFRIFWQIAMSLSKPIMAVIALGAFNAAYRNFMFAFIVCQDSSMWTMMVHIYQLIQRSAPGVGFAALVIAAIPTFAVFVFFQNIIIRGIVVPTEK